MNNELRFIGSKGGTFEIDTSGPTVETRTGHFDIDMIRTPPLLLSKEQAEFLMNVAIAEDLDSVSDAIVSVIQQAMDSRKAYKEK